MCSRGGAESAEDAEELGFHCGLQHMEIRTLEAASLRWTMNVKFAKGRRQRQLEAAFPWLDDGRHRAALPLTIS